MIDAYTLERDILPVLRRDIDAIRTGDTFDRRTAVKTQDALYTLVALVSELTERVRALEARP
jgi:hypothetical protein